MTSTPEEEGREAAKDASNEPLEVKLIAAASDGHVNVTPEKCEMIRKILARHYPTPSQGGKEGSATIKNFHCSVHGYITPHPICPKCAPTPSQGGKAGEAYDKAVKLADDLAKLRHDKRDDAFFKAFAGEAGEGKEWESAFDALKEPDNGDVEYHCIECELRVKGFIRSLLTAEREKEYLRGTLDGYEEGGMEGFKDGRRAERTRIRGRVEDLKKIQRRKNTPTFELRDFTKRQLGWNAAIEMVLTLLDNPDDHEAGTQ